MAGLDTALEAHLATGVTTVCHAWSITRSDGKQFGFTDHDVDLAFDGMIFRADTGLGALALSQSTGLAVDNSEAVGALSDVAIREDEIEQGRFDGAEVRAWLVNWADVSQRWLNFRGALGELVRTDGAFRAELRGLTEALNRPLGRIYQKPCTAVLGDGGCQFDLAQPGYVTERIVEDVALSRDFVWEDFSGFEAGWFARGRLQVLDGPAAGLWGMIKNDVLRDGQRHVDLWQPIRGEITSGTRVELIAGCDKRAESCRLKFNNFMNFQGFPDLPGEDWVMAIPRSSGANTGGSRR